MNINSFEYFEENTKDWTRDDLLKRCYDLCNEKSNQQQEIDRLNKIINKIEEFIQLKIIRYENEKDYLLEPQDILDIYYHLKSLKEEGK